jgi:hypothetical protein
VTRAKAAAVVLPVVLLLVAMAYLHGRSDCPRPEWWLTLFEWLSEDACAFFEPSIQPR